MKKMMALILTVALCSMVLVGCGSSNAASSGNASSPEVGTSPLSPLSNEVYYFVNYNSGIDYWNDLKDGFQSAADIFGAKVVFSGATEYDITQAVTVLDQVIATTPTGISVAVMNADAYVTSIETAIENGITVVTVDGDSSASGRATFLGTGNYAAGVSAAHALVESMGTSGSVGLVASPGQENLDQRAAGFIDTLTNEYPDIKVVQEVNGAANADTAYTATAAMLQAHPEITGVYAVCADNGVGALTAIDESGRDSEISFVSFDVDDALLDAVKAGKCDALIAQNAWNMGFWSFIELYLEAHGCTVQPNGISVLPESIDTGTVIVTAENADSFR